MKILHKQSLVYIITWIIVFCGICIITWVSLSKAFYKDKLKDIEYFASGVLNEIDLFFFEKECGLKILSTSPMIRGNFSEKTITERLIEFRNLNKSYISVSYFDINRVRIADTAGLCIGKTDPAHGFWKDIKKGKSSIGSYIEKSSSLKKNVIYFAVPVLDHDNKLKGAVVARLPNEFLSNLFKSALRISNLFENLYIDLCSSDGVIIFSNHNSKSILSGKSHDFNYICKKIKGGKNRGLIFNDKFSIKEDSIGFYAKEKGFMSFKGNNWVLILHYPLKYVYSHLYMLMSDWFIIALLCLIIVIFVCLYLSKKLSVPLNILSKRVMDFGNGNLEVRADIKTNDEISNLAQVFNIMADNLSKNTTSIIDLEREVDFRVKVENDLKEQKAFTDGVLNTAQAIILVLDNNGNIKYFNPYLEVISGYTLAEMKGKNWISSFLPKVEQDKIKEVLNTSLSGIDTKGNINSILTKKREHRYIEWFDSKLKSSNGTVKGIVAVGIDITARITYEKDLELFKTLLNSSIDAIFLIDIENSKIIDVNDAACQALGYSRNEMLSLSVTDVDAVVSNSAEWNSFINSLKGSGIIMRTSKHIRKNGEIFPVEIGIKLKEYSGKQYMVAVARDITKRKKTEELLLKEKAYSENLVKSLTDGFLVHDLDGTIIDVNNSIEKITGFTRDEIVGRKIFEFATGSQIELMRSTATAVLNNNAVSVEHIINKKNGEQLNILVTSSPFKDAKNKVVGALAIIRDITQMKIRELKLIESENKFRKLFESSTDAILWANQTSGLITNCNRAAENLFECNRSYLIGKHQSIVHPPEKKEYYKQAFKKHKDDIVGKIITRKGNIRNVIISPTLIEVNEEKINQRIFHDITELKKAEALLLRDQRIKSIGEVSAGIAHDFNNTLQRILTGTETLLSINTLDEASSYTLTRIKESAELSAKRIRQLLLFSGQSGIKKEKSTFDLEKSINSTIQQISPIIKKINETQNIKINIDFISAGNVFIRGYIGEFQDVLYNLLKNSIDAMPEGGKITICSRIKDGKIKLNISDTGIGMDKDTAAKAFEPFFTTKELGKGTGVGLSSSYGIVKNMGGEITIKKTQINRGCEIEIILPSAIGKKRKKINEKPKDVIAEILWVEDDKDIREMGKTLLEIIGHQVITAGSGEKALKILKKNKVDVMITDIGMPEMNGWELADKVKTLYPNIKIVVLSGWNNDISDRELKKRKISSIIQKPINRNQLAKVISDIMLKE